MYAVHSQNLPPKTIHVTLSCCGHPMSWEDVLSAWSGDPLFRTFYNDLIAESPFTAVRWETPGITIDALQSHFEFVLIDAPRLAVSADHRAFAEHFRQDAPGEGVVAFESLGGDALLIVPSPCGSEYAYPHLAAFCRKAPAAQRDALWRIVGETMRARLSPRRLWLNTAGGGVAWLHIRLDSRPKYYHHAPYKIA